MGLLDTDAYKFSMGAAGFPMRTETFYLSFRKGLPQYIGFNLAHRVEEIVTNVRRYTQIDLDYLSSHGYDVTLCMKTALAGKIKVNCPPVGCWVLPNEPILSVTGPSFLVSVIEPLVIQLHYEIQLETAIRRGHRNDELFTYACLGQKRIIEGVLDRIGPDLSWSPPLIDGSSRYFGAVYMRARRLVKAANNNPTMIFDVGLRSASCPEQHKLAMRACKNAGISSTSNLAAARDLGTIPVGTTGHEHIMRFEKQIEAFRAIRDRCVRSPSYLLDTYDTTSSGIPDALEVINECLGQNTSIRYDSGKIASQIEFALMSGMPHEIEQIIEGGIDPDLIAIYDQKLRDLKRSYGVGGFLVCDDSSGGITRSAVSAAYKLSKTGHRPVMKFSDSPGKSSYPGKPVIFRRIQHGHQWNPPGLIGQEGEDPSLGYIVLNSGTSSGLISLCNKHASRHTPIALSEATLDLKESFKKAINAST